MSQLSNNPKIWSKFQKVHPKTGQIHNFTIQELTEDFYESALNLFLNDFNQDEPIAKSLDLSNDLSSIKELSEMWINTFKEGVSLACFDEDKNTLIGVNALLIETGDETYSITSERFKKQFDANMYIAQKVDIKAKYGVDRYLGAFGLVVHRDYRGLGLGTEILKARIPLCKSLGLKVTSNNFSGAASQKCALKAGFCTDISVSYEDLAKIGYDFENVTENCIKVMSLQIN